MGGAIGKGVGAIPECLNGVRDTGTVAESQSMVRETMELYLVCGWTVRT